MIANFGANNITLPKEKTPQISGQLISKIYSSL